MFSLLGLMASNVKFDLSVRKSIFREALIIVVAWLKGFPGLALLMHLARKVARVHGIRGGEIGH